MNHGKELNKLRPRVALTCKNPDHPHDKPREYLGFANSKYQVCSKACRNRVAYLKRLEIKQ